MKKITLFFLYFFVFEALVSYAQFSKVYDFPAENDLVYSGYSQPIFDGTWLYDVSPNGGINALGCIFKVKPDGTGLTKLIDFAGTTNGSFPNGSLTLFGSVLYGMTSSGGSSNNGTIFKINTDGSGFTKLMDFTGIANGSSPYSSLTQSGSVFYGMTRTGGINDKGTIFKISIDGTGYTKLLDFVGTTNGSNPYGCLTISGSVLYGMTSSGGSSNYGTIFKINTDGTGFTKLLDFSGLTKGGNPYGSLTLSGSVLFGMTRDWGQNLCGILFKINIDGTGYVKLLDFSPSLNGSYPLGSLTLSGSVLYGMTGQSGANGKGTIFKINTDGTGFTKILDFTGTLDGSIPKGSLTLSGSVLFGATSNGGISGKGSFFKVNTDGSGFTKILDYNKALFGASPYGSLTVSGSYLYGMTGYGGLNGCGTIYKIITDGTEYTDLFNFNGVSTGYNPYGSLTLSGSSLYGMTCRGGANNKGTIFKISTDGTGYTKLMDFVGVSNGSNPYGSLIISGSVLYGMTYSGGTNDKGVIFKLNTDGTGFSKLLDFDGSTNGMWSDGSLTLSESTLFGMTTSGGANGKGTIFKISTDGTGYAILLDFVGTTNGSFPVGSLLINGSALYGMTNEGGANGFGTIFKISTDGLNYTKLFDFMGLNGKFPSGSLTLVGSVLYGTTEKGGANGFGSIFKINTDGTEFANLQDFNGVNGRLPYQSVLILNSNALYGTTVGGGSMKAGTIFKYNLVGTAVDKKNAFSTNFLNQNYPNPFDQSTNIDFKLVKPGKVNLTIYNSLGQVVDIIVDEYLSVGNYSKQWIPMGIASGIYFYQLKADGVKETKRLIKK